MRYVRGDVSSHIFVQFKYIYFVHRVLTYSLEGKANTKIDTQKLIS